MSILRAIKKIKENEEIMEEFNSVFSSAKGEIKEVSSGLKNKCSDFKREATRFKKNFLTKKA